MDFFRIEEKKDGADNISIQGAKVCANITYALSWLKEWETI